MIMLICVRYRRGGRICLTDHFKPLWARNVPKFGIAHAMALGVSGKIILESPSSIIVQYFSVEFISVGKGGGGRRGYFCLLHLLCGYPLGFMLRPLPRPEFGTMRSPPPPLE